ncbi:MAG TPA: D-alanine--D-alanine ligase [Mycobacteriales bacterium]|nr:D-alanine--D-alanine ligase [Mycobacteriales bacterium]
MSNGAAAELHAVILAGGLTFEREVSQRSGRRVADALKHAGLEAPILDTDITLVDQLAASRPDAVFIALHGGAGEDGALRSVLDLIDVPYVGSTPGACRMAWDKPNAKAAVRSAGLPTPDWVALPQTTFRELGAQVVLDRIVARLGLPLMVKPAQGGSALGAHRVDAVEDLPAAMVGCFAYCDTALIERFLPGVELAISVVAGPGGLEVLPAVEIVPFSGVFDYASRYNAGMTTYHRPARLEPSVAAEAARLAERAHRVLGLRDLSRTDAIVTPAGEVHFLEVNVAPGMTETSLLPMAVEAAELDLGELCVALLHRAAGRSRIDSSV